MYSEADQPKHLFTFAMQNISMCVGKGLYIFFLPEAPYTSSHASSDYAPLYLMELTTRNICIGLQFNSPILWKALSPANAVMWLENMLHPVGQGSLTCANYTAVAIYWAVTIQVDPAPFLASIHPCLSLLPIPTVPSHPCADLPALKVVDRLLVHCHWAICSLLVAVARPCWMAGGILALAIKELALPEHSSGSTRPS